MLHWSICMCWYHFEREPEQRWEWNDPCSQLHASGCFQRSSPARDSFSRWSWRHQERKSPICLLDIFEHQPVYCLASSEQILYGGTLRIHQLGEWLIYLKLILLDPDPEALLDNSHFGVGLWELFWTFRSELGRCLRKLPGSWYRIPRSLLTIRN